MCSFLSQEVPFPESANQLRFDQERVRPLQRVASAWLPRPPSCKSCCNVCSSQDIHHVPELPGSTRNNAAFCSNRGMILRSFHTVSCGQQSTAGGRTSGSAEHRLLLITLSHPCPYSSPCRSLYQFKEKATPSHFPPTKSHSKSTPSM